MPDNDGQIGYGSVLKVRTSTGPDVWTVLGKQAEVQPPGTTVDSIDVSHTQSPGAMREFIPGMGEVTEATTTLNFKPGSSPYATLRGMLRTIQLLRSVFPDGSYWQYEAFITELGPETPIDDKMTLAVTWKATGDLTPFQAAQPSNTLLPSISGIPQVGVTLTADEGIWANEPTSFTYQWQSDNVNIGGATSRTYVPIVGQIAATLSVIVTGVNSAGSASAESAGAIDVIAA